MGTHETQKPRLSRRWTLLKRSSQPFSLAWKRPVLGARVSKLDSRSFLRTPWPTSKSLKHMLFHHQRRSSVLLQQLKLKHLLKARLRQQWRVFPQQRREALAFFGRELVVVSGDASE